MHNRSEQINAESCGEVLKTNCPEPLERVHIQPFTCHHGNREHRLDTVVDRVCATTPSKRDYRVHSTLPERWSPVKKSQAPYRPNDPDTSTTHPSDADPFLLLTTPGGTPDAWISNQNTALGAALLPDLTAIGPRAAG